jgi:hypothetical protein
MKIAQKAAGFEEKNIKAVKEERLMSTISPQMHIVHFDHSKYESIQYAAPERDGLAVLGVFFEVLNQYA